MTRADARWAPHGGGRRPPDPENVKTALDLLAQGMSRSKVAVHLGVSEGTISNWTKEPKARPVIPPDEGDVIVVAGVRHVLALVRDPMPGLLYARRRGNCPRLAHCERAWAMKHGGMQGACPEGCPGPR